VARVGRRKSFGPKKKGIKLDGPRSEMNVTPLVDVCLVLLIIFMVIMPLLARGKEVALPKTANHSSESDKNQPIIAINENGEVYFDKDHITDVMPVQAAPGQQGRRWKLKDGAVLRRTLDDAWRRAAESRTKEQESVTHKVFFKDDKGLPYGMVYPVIMELHEIGVSSIDLGTNELRQDAD